MKMWKLLSFSYSLLANHYSLICDTLLLLIELFLNAYCDYFMWQIIGIVSEHFWKATPKITANFNTALHNLRVESQKRNSDISSKSLQCNSLRDFERTETRQAWNEARVERWGSRSVEVKKGNCMTVLLRVSCPRKKRFTKRRRLPSVKSRRHSLTSSRDFVFLKSRLDVPMDFWSQKIQIEIKFRKDTRT